MEVPSSVYLQAVPTINQSTVLCGLITIIVGMFWVFQQQRRLPPGPPLYGLGHFLRLTRHPLLELRQLRKQYGDVIKLYLGTRMAVVLNGYDVINEVLQSRGPEFSHRPSSFLAEKVAQYKGLLNTSGKVWLEQKSSVMRSLRSFTSTGGWLDQHLELEVSRLCGQLELAAKDKAERGLDVAPFIRKSICSTAFFMVFGRVLDHDSKELTMFCDNMKELFRYLGNLAVVNFLPFVHMLPGDPVCYHRCMEIIRVIEEELIKPEIDRLKQITDGSQDTEVSSRLFRSRYFSEADQMTGGLVGGYLQDMKTKRSKGIDTELNEEHLVKSAGDLMAGGYDTVSNTLQWLVIYLVHHQHVQEACRKEIQGALAKSGGHVTSTRRSDLVYTQATIMEVQRLANVGPFPPAHCSDHDTEIRGFHIPKDTLIMVNLDSLMMGPHVEEPTSFRPDRFIDPQGKLVQPAWFMPYTTGTRMCLGALVAKKELLAVTMALLSRFRLTAPLVDGQRLTPSLVGDLGLTHVPKPFTVQLQSLTS